MSFMKPQIYQGDYYLVDGDNGTDLIPGDVIQLAIDVGQTIDEPDTELTVWLEPYTENREIYSVERCAGFYGRYSAPGYIDCTDWTWGATEQEVSESLQEMYG